MHHRARLSLTAAAVLVLAASCARAPQDAVSAPPGPAWYVLEAGRFVSLPDGRLPSTEPQAMLPWTAQERVAGFARLGAAVYVSVNGQGAASVTPRGSGAVFGYLYDKTVFRGRTFRTILAETDTLLCHVYKDSLLDGPPDGGDAGAPNLVRMRPGSEGFEMDFVRPTLQAAEAGWQPVSVVRAGASRYWIEWKRSVSDLTEFAYTSLDAAAGAEARVSREEFRDAYRATPLQGFAPNPASSSDLLVARLASRAAPGQYLHIQVEGPDGPDHFVRLPPGAEASALTVPVATDGGRALALEPDGTLLEARGGEVRSARMPGLPAGFVYTAFTAVGDTIVAAWEQADFYKVGRAGLVVTRVAL